MHNEGFDNYPNNNNNEMKINKNESQNQSIMSPIQRLGKIKSKKEEKEQEIMNQREHDPKDMFKSKDLQSH